MRRISGGRNGAVHCGSIMKASDKSRQDALRSSGQAGATSRPQVLSYHYQPAAPLDRFVHVIWCMEQGPTAHPRERLLPDGSVELVINLHEERVPVYTRGNLERCEVFHGSVVCGPHSRFFAIDTASELNVVGVHFKPGGAFPFFKLPSGELHNLHVGLDALWGRAAAGEMRERLLAAATPEARARVLERALLAAAGGVLERHPAVAFALNAFHEAAETRRIGEVTEQIGLSPRRFIEVFRKEVGLSPKLFCRVRRFQKVLRMIAVGRAVDWAEIAVTCGYFDQAHFIHDFQDFSGINPSSYLADHIEHLNHVPIHG
jgi:AraC-like DNA-binding protein